MDSAERLLSEKGLAGLKAREVAAGAGCALGAIYTAFGDLDEVILRVGLRTLGRLEAELRARGEGDALERLALAYLAFARREKPCLERALRFSPAARRNPSRLVRHQSGTGLFTLLEAPLSRAPPDCAKRTKSGDARARSFPPCMAIVALGLEEKLGEGM